MLPVNASHSCGGPVATGKSSVCPSIFLAHLKSDVQAGAQVRDAKTGAPRAGSHDSRGPAGCNAPVRIESPRTGALVSAPMAAERALPGRPSIVRALDRPTALSTGATFPWMHRRQRLSSRPRKAQKNAGSPAGGRAEMGDNGAARDPHRFRAAIPRCRRSDRLLHSAQRKVSFVSIGLKIPGERFHGCSRVYGGVAVGDRIPAGRHP